MDIETTSVLRRPARPAVGPGRSAPGRAWGFILTLFLLLGGSPAPAAIAAAEPRDFQTIREYLDTARALKGTDRVRVRGTVTHVSADGTFFIQDQTAGVYVFYRTNNPFKSAEIVEVTASPSLGGFSPSLQRCTVARVGAGVLPRPVPVTISTVLSGKYDMQWVQIEGRLSFDRLRRGGQMVLILEADADNFTVEIDPRGQEEALARLRPGSQLRVTGVCSVRPDATKTPTSFHVLVNSLNDLVELAPPPWWTPVRTLRVLGLAGFGLALALAWAGLLRRQVRKQTGIIRERLQKEAAIEGQFRELVEHAVDVIYTHDLQGRFTSWNHAGETILGYPRAEIIGMNIAQLIVPGQEEVSGRMVTPATAEHAAPTYKLELRTQDGRRRTFEISSWLVTRAGQAVEVQGIGRDITERERVEAALRESEDRYRILVELSPEAIVVHRGGIILFVNKAYLELIGATGPAQLLGRTVVDFVHPDFRANVLNRIERTQATEEPVPAAELQCIRLDGCLLDVEAVSVGITYQGDRATLAVLRDITERKRAEQIRETLRDLAQQLTGSLSLKSLGRIVAAACRRLFQYDAFLLYSMNPHSGERTVVHAEDTPSGGSAPVEVEPVFTEGQSRIENRVFNGEQELINRFEEPEPTGIETWGYTNRMSRSLLFVPVRWEGRCVGVITVQSYTPGQYQERDLETLQVIADQCGGAAMRVLGETALRASEEQLRRALAAARMGTWDWDITRNTVQWSARVEDIFGRHPGEFRGTYDAFIALIHPDDRQFVVGAILDCAEGARDDYQIEHRIVLPDGTTRWIEGKGRIDRDEASRAIRMAGTVLDITERKGTEQKLRESERSLFEFLVQVKSLVCRQRLAAC